MQFPQTFNTSLRRHRMSAGKTYKQMSEAMSIAIQSYQRYEQGVREPNIDQIVFLADFFNVSLDELFGREFPKHSQ